MTKNWSFAKITDILQKKIRSVIVSQNHYLNKILDVRPLIGKPLSLRLLTPANLAHLNQNYGNFIRKGNGPFTVTTKIMFNLKFYLRKFSPCWFETKVFCVNVIFSHLDKKNNKLYYKQGLSFRSSTKPLKKKMIWLRLYHWL